MNYEDIKKIIDERIVDIDQQIEALPLNGNSDKRISINKVKLVSAAAELSHLQLILTAKLLAESLNPKEPIKDCLREMNKYEEFLETLSGHYYEKDLLPEPVL